MNFSIFRAPNQKSTKEAINMLSKFPGLEIREVVGIKKQLFSAIYSFPTTSALHGLSEFGLRLYPIYANNGIDKWFNNLSDKNVAPLLTSINDETTKLIEWRKLGDQNSTKLTPSYSWTYRGSTRWRIYRHPTDRS